MEIENFNEENILVGMLASICKTRICSFEEVVRVMLIDGELLDNKYLAEVEKYNLLSSFWKLCEQHFGYTDPNPNVYELTMTSTIDYYNKNAIAFSDNTRDVSFTDIQDRFLSLLPPGANILDFGCASILHLERSKLSNVMGRLERAVRPGGIIYASFKYGTYEGMRNDRYFTDFTEETFTGVLDDLCQKDICQGTEIIDLWTTKDVRPGRSEEIWLNVILQRLERR